MPPKVYEKKLTDFLPDKSNANRGTARGRKLLGESLEKLGAGRSIVADANDQISAGNKSLQAMVEAGFENAIVVETDGKTAVVVKRTDWDLDDPKGAARRYAYYDNRVAEVDLEWDRDELLTSIEAGTDLAGLWDQKELNELLGKVEPEKERPTPPSLADRFGVPPFTVLDARQGYWQERKRQWIGMGIASGDGRGQNLIKRSAGEMLCQYTTLHYAEAREIVERERARLGDKFDVQELIRQHGGRPEASAAKRLTWAKGDRPLEEVDEVTRKHAEATGGTSIFDPVLCELVYRWWVPPGGAVLDPFAGGSVRGLVAALTGHPYVGIDLRPEQVAANVEQLGILKLPSVAGDAAPPPARWIVGDSRDLDAILPADEGADLVFSCPPYYDLEVYSEDPKDLSNLDSYQTFLADYRRIIGRAVARLREDRFAVFVVGDVRDKQGFYRNFVSDTIAAFEDAGARLYNEAILVTALGTLPLRAGTFFPKTRKLGKAHQNVLVFYKGDPKRIPIVFPEIEVALEIETPDDDRKPEELL